MQEATEKAIEQVKNNNHDFYLHALSFARDWVKTQFKKFSSEDLREAYYLKNSKAREERFWGAVMNTLKKEGAIKFHSYQKYKDPVGHGRPSTVWISKVYAQKQQKNRTINSRTQVRLF